MLSCLKLISHNSTQKGNHKNLSKAQNSKSKFRNTSKWKKFRKSLKEKRKIDEVTLRPLYKGWNLHHMILDPKKYEDLTNEDNFATLNSNTHDIIHFLFNYYKNDPSILDRIEYILEEMKVKNERYLLEESKKKKDGRK